MNDRPRKMQLITAETDNKSPTINGVKCNKSLKSMMQVTTIVPLQLHNNDCINYPTGTVVASGQLIFLHSSK